MIDLVEFITARLDRDEAAALAASPNTWTVEPWKNEHGVEFLIVPDGSTSTAAVVPRGPANAVHIARHDPARVLREVEAKRALLKLHGPVIDGTQSSWTWFEGSESASDKVCRLLALPYADHPDYQTEWAP